MVLTVLLSFISVFIGGIYPCNCWFRVGVTFSHYITRSIITATGLGWCYGDDLRFTGLGRMDAFMIA